MYGNECISRPLAGLAFQELYEKKSARYSAIIANLESNF